MKITYIGGPTILFEYAGLRFLTDPTFDSAGSEFVIGPVTLTKTTDPRETAAAVGNVDVVLLSHEHHFDNLDNGGREFLKLAALVLTTRDGALRLAPNATGLEPWQQIDVEGKVHITATPARHGPADFDNGPVIGFVLQGGEEDVYIAGDTVWYEGVEEVIGRFPNIKTAVLFCGSAQVPIKPAPLTMTAADALRFAQAAPHCQIVPVHYEGWKHFSEGREDLVRAFDAAGLSARLHWPD